MNDGEAIIEISGVKKRFGKQVVHDGIDLTVKQGETIVIVGASGQGKSLLLKYMLGLMDPDEGSVRLFGKNINELDSREMGEIRKRYGVLFQNAALLDSMSIFDNVALPLRERTKLGEKEIRDRVMDRLSLVELAHAPDKFPAQLSGGMRKRAGLARALALEPEVVFFDEPTTGLDVIKSKEIYNLLRLTRERLGYTAVIVSHDAPKIFKLADKIALLAGGRIQACLSPEEFQLSPNPDVKRYVESTMGPAFDSGLYEQVAG